MNRRLDNGIPQNESDLLPCELWPGSRIDSDLEFSEPMDVLCVEAKTFEIPTGSLMQCAPHTYILIQVLLRFASQLHSKYEQHAVVCSIVEPSCLMEESVRGKVSCGIIFWLLYPQRCNHLAYVVKDILMVTNGFFNWDTTLGTDIGYESLMQEDEEEQTEEEQEDDDEEIFDGRGRNQRRIQGPRKKKRKRDDPILAMRYSFKNFDSALGRGTSRMKKIARSVSKVPSLKVLGDLDRSVEKYYCLQIPGMNKERLSKPVREIDLPGAWEIRTSLLSPEKLYGSSRRTRHRRELTLALREYDDTIGGGKGALSLEDLMEASDRPGLPTSLKRSLDQIDTRVLMKEPTNSDCFSFGHMVAWKLESFMFDADYFLKRRFPTLESNTEGGSAKHIVHAMRDDAEQMDEKKLESIGKLYLTNQNLNEATVDSRLLFGEKYTAKNPGVVLLWKTLKDLQLTPDRYRDKTHSKVYFDIFKQAHLTKSVQMSEVITQSYADRWDRDMPGWCLNSCTDPNGCFVPHVYVTGGRDNDDGGNGNTTSVDEAGYQLMTNLVNLMGNVSGTSNTKGELLYMLLAGIRIVCPHDSMAMHGILVGPPGTGKTSVMIAAKAIIGHAYSDDVTYRTQKAVLVDNERKYKNSKKVRFMNEFVPPSSGSKSDKNPLAVESSQEAAIMKEELDSGCTRTERTEKVVDPNTGSTRHGIRTVVNVCDNATFMAMNEKDVCESINSRVVTFEVPPSGLVTVPKKTEGYEADMARYKIRTLYGAVRHKVMEHKRLIEVGLYPRRSEGDSYCDVKGLMLAYDRICRTMESCNLKSGMSMDMRFRNQVFELAKFTALINGVVKVYGYPKSSIHESTEPLPGGENACCRNTRVIRKHQAWLKKQDLHTLHNHVVAESQVDVCDLFTAFSIIHPMPQNELAILKTTADHLIDPAAETMTKDGDTYFVLTCRTEDSLLTALERKTAIPKKRCKEILSNLHSGVRKSFRAIDEGGCKFFLLLCSVGTDAYLASHDDSFREISDTMMKQMDVNDPRQYVDKNYKKVLLNKKDTHDVRFLSHLKMHSRHTYWNGADPTSTFKYLNREPTALDNNGERFVAEINFDFNETRLRYLKKCVYNSCKQGQCDSHGVVRVEVCGNELFDCLRPLTSRLWDGSRDRQPMPLSPPTSDDEEEESERECESDETRSCRLVLRTSVDGSYMVHLSSLLPAWRNLCLAKLCLAALAKDENACRGDRIRVDTNDEHELKELNDCTDVETNDLKRLKNSSSIVRATRSTRVFLVNLLVLNSTEEACRHYRVKLDESMMKNVMEKSAFRNMTDRKSLMYVDRAAKDVFQTLDLQALADKNGGSLPEHTCKNPYLRQTLCNPTTEVVDSDRLKFKRKEPNLLTVERSHARLRKAWTQMLANGSEYEIRRKHGHDRSIYNREVRKMQERMIKIDETYGFSPLIYNTGEKKLWPCTCSSSREKNIEPFLYQ